MTRKKDKTEGMKWKELIGGQEDFLRPLVREVIQQVLEAEMEEVVGAGERRTDSGTGGIPSGVLRTDIGNASGETRATGTAGPAGAVSDRSV